MRTRRVKAGGAAAGPEFPYWAWPAGGAAAFAPPARPPAAAFSTSTLHPPSPNKPNTQGKSPATPPATPARPLRPSRRLRAAELLQNGFSYAYRIEGDNDVLALTNRKADFRQGQLTLMWRRNGTVARQAVYNIVLVEGRGNHDCSILRHSPSDLKFQFRFLRRIGTSTFAGHPCFNPPG